MNPINADWTAILFIISFVLIALYWILRALHHKAAALPWCSAAVLVATAVLAYNAAAVAW
jgi:hypothetical protein